MTMRAILVAVLVLLLLIPLAMVQDLVGEREYRKDEAVNEVSATWGGSQTITGPADQRAVPSHGSGGPGGWAERDAQRNALRTLPSGKA